MSQLRATANAISNSVSGDDEFANALIETTPEVNKWLDNCTPSPGCPDNPNTSATEAEQKAWQDAHTVKESAKQATGHHKKAMAHHLRRQKRKDGTPISEAHAESLSESLNSKAISQSQEEIAAALLESRQSN